MNATSWVSEAPTRLRQRANRSVRHAIGLNREPPAICSDPSEAYLPVDGIARIVHGDLHSMVIGGLGSLFFQMLHPHTMAGVAQHSRYQEDALGRVLQTANFISATTFGSNETAHTAIKQVLAIHQRVTGIADDGEPYFANDPHLLAWVHDAGTSMFLTAYQRFGAQRLSDSDADAYVNELTVVARDFGIPDPPTSVAELNACLEAFRPELRLNADGVVARDFIAHGVVRGVHQKLAYRLLVDSAFDLLEPWARELLGVPTKPTLNRLVVRSATSTLGSFIRLVVPPTKPVTSRD